MFSKEYILQHEDELRNELVGEAKKWLGAKYHVNAMLQYKACDCHTLLIMVYEACGLIQKNTKPIFYRPDFSFHSKEETYLKGLQKYGSATEEYKPGDIILYRYAKLIDHTAIIINSEGLMLDSCITRGVAYGDYNQDINKSREVAVYTIFNK